MREREREKKHSVTERVSLSEQNVAKKRKSKGKCCSGLCLNGMIYLDVVTDELYKVVYKFTSLHFPLLSSALLHWKCVSQGSQTVFKVDLIHACTEKTMQVIRLSSLRRIA